MKKELYTLANSLNKLGLKKESKQIYDILKYAAPIEEVSFSGRGGEIENKLIKIIDDTKKEFEKIKVTFDIATVPEELQIQSPSFIPSISLNNITKDNSTEEILYNILKKPSIQKKIIEAKVIKIIDQIDKIASIESNLLKGYSEKLTDILDKIDASPQEGYSSLIETLNDMKTKIDELRKLRKEYSEVCKETYENINEILDTYNKIKDLAQWIKNKSSESKAQALIIWGLTGDNFTEQVSLDNPHWIIHDVYHIIETLEKTNPKVKNLSDKLIALDFKLKILDSSGYEEMIKSVTPDVEAFDYYASLFSIIVTYPNKIKNLISNSNSQDEGLKELILKNYKDIFDFAKENEVALENDFKEIFGVFENKILFLP